MIFSSRIFLDDTRCIDVGAIVSFPDPRKWYLKLWHWITFNPIRKRYNQKYVVTMVNSNTEVTIDKQRKGKSNVSYCVKTND